jgi:hypothetical protein
LPDLSYPPFRHLVLVEKWVTDTELKELERVKLLGWQSDDEDSKNGNNDDLNSIGEVEDAGSPVTTKVCLSSLASAACPDDHLC